MCRAKKHTKPLPAQQLYIGEYYSMLKKHKDAHVDVFILSAEHGLISGDTIISPYETKMTSERFEILKGGGRIKQMVETLGPYEKVMVNAGQEYLELLKLTGLKNLIFPPFLRKRRIIKDFLIEHSPKDNSQKRIFDG